MFIHLQTHPKWQAMGLLHESNARIGLLRNQINGLLVKNLRVSSTGNPTVSQSIPKLEVQGEPPKFLYLLGFIGKVMPILSKIQYVPFLHLSIHDFIVRIFPKKNLRQGTLLWLDASSTGVMASKTLSSWPNSDLQIIVIYTS